MFEIDRGNISNQKSLIEAFDGLNFIAQNDASNGFVKKIKNGNYKKFLGNSIVIGRQTGVAYFQPEEFTTTDGVLVLKNKIDVIKNKLGGLFLLTILKQKLYNFCYTNTVSAGKISEFEINLPTLENGDIDFSFMESFIRGIEKLVIKDLVLRTDEKVKAYKAVISK